MKVYSVKINDFKNLKSKVVYEQDEHLNTQVDNIEQKYNVKINRALFKGRGLVLCIGVDSKNQPVYVITGRPCYQKSLVDLLKSVDIEQPIIDNTTNTAVDLTTNDLKTILKS